MSAGAAARDAAAAVLEAPMGGGLNVAPTAVSGGQPPQRGQSRRPAPVKQRGRAGAAQTPYDQKHPHVSAGRVGGGQFATKTPAEKAQTAEDQQRLKRAGLYKGAIDGLAGPQTKAAVEQFQQRYNLPQTGVVDAATRATLQAPPPLTAGQVARQEAQQALASKPSGSSSRSRSSSGSSAAGTTGGTSGSATTLDTTNKAAVQKFQRDHGLKVDGVVGPETRGAMEASGTSSKDGSIKGHAQASGAGSSRKAAAGSSSAPGGVLRQGAGMNKARGLPQVKQYQSLLQDLGYDLGAPGADGKFGPVTAKAVKAFQREHGLKADGVIGRHTLRLLNMAHARSSSRVSKTNAPLSLDQEPLSPQQRAATGTPRPSPRRVQQAGLMAAEAAMLVLEAPDHQPPSQQEREELRRRFPRHAGEVSLKRDKDGVFVHTHRARSRSYPSVAKLPETAVKSIASTG